MNEKISPTQSGILRVFLSEPKDGPVTDDKTFFFVGNVTSQTINQLIPEPGVGLPIARIHDSTKDVLLTVFHFNDLHGHLVRFFDGGEDPVISRMAGQIHEKRKSVASDDHKAVLTFTTGDDSIGSVFDELLGSNPDNFSVHASYQLYSALKIDAACLGNHDFDLGFPLLAKSIFDNAKFPVLSANISGHSILSNLCFPAVIKVVKGIRIGIIGLVTQAELKIAEQDFMVTDPVFAANNIISTIKPYCDVIIILSHLGLTMTNSSIPMINVGDVELAEKLPFGSVQLIIGGHSHHELNTQGLSPKNIVNGIPIVQTGALGKYLGQVDIKVGQKNTAVTNVRLLSTASLPIDLDFEENEVQPILLQARSLFSRSLGSVSDNNELHTDYVRNSFASGELAFANFITDAIPARLELIGHHVDLAMIDSSSLRKGLRPGQSVTFGDWFNVMPFADTIRFYRITGRQLFDLLQDNAKRIDRPNEPHTERGFLQFSHNLRYFISLNSSRSKSEAIEININDLPLTDQFEKLFVLAGTNFIREYANSWERIDDQHQNCSFVDLHKIAYSDSEIFLRRELVTFIQEKKGVTTESGAKLDGRLKVIDHTPLKVSSMQLDHFIEHVSQQNHAMAGAVIASSAAQAVALGQACMSISINQLELFDPNIQTECGRLMAIQQQLTNYCDRDATAIAEFVALRESGQELQGKEILCNLPLQVCKQSVNAANILIGFRPLVNERVKDDLEMSIKLLHGAASSAMLLLDSNLRIWLDEDLHRKFEPILNELIVSISELSPVDRIRSIPGNN